MLVDVRDAAVSNLKRVDTIYKKTLGEHLLSVLRICADFVSMLRQNRYFLEGGDRGLPIR